MHPKNPTGKVGNSHKLERKSRKKKKKPALLPDLIQLIKKRVVD